MLTSTQVEGFVDPPTETALKYYAGGFTSDYHGKSGPIKKSFAHYFNPLHVPFLDAVINMGVPLNEDTVCSSSPYRPSSVHGQIFTLILRND